MNLSLRILLTVVNISLLAGVSAANVPSPGNSTIPGCVLTTPGGNLVDIVVVRDFGGNPIGNSVVVLDYSACPQFSPCPQDPNLPRDGYVVDPAARTIRMVTGPNGQAPFYLRAGGGCSNDGIRIFADGVLLATRRAASADQNGDHVVDGTDVTLLHAKIDSADLSGDLDCDGAVGRHDESIVIGYIGVNCVDPTPSRRGGWGKLRSIYR